MTKKLLLTGGTGRLGTELQKLRKYDFAPTHEEMEIRDSDDVMEYIAPKPIDLIVHCAAYTAVERAEEEQDDCWGTNVLGTRHLAEAGVPLLYISTEYVFGGEKGNYCEEDTPYPRNFYALTKLMGEHQLNVHSKIVRLVFKPNPWPYPGAFDDQWTSGDYVEVMAKEVDKAITLFDKLCPITHLGTGRKSIYDLAKRTRRVKAISRRGAKATLPMDTSLNTFLWDSLKKNHGMQ